MSQSPSHLEEGTDLNLQFDKRGGLLPVVVQETATGDILMLASLNREALSHSLETGRAAFWSTSRGELWVKGLTSGNTMRLDEVLIDCDQDALIYKVTLEGTGACHTKNRDGIHRKSCFYRKLNSDTQKLEYSDA
jgi:phosphoribosyl-AMP cyclohydrolase